MAGDGEDPAGRRRSRRWPAFSRGRTAPCKATVGTMNGHADAISLRHKPVDAWGTEWQETACCPALRASAGRLGKCRSIGSAGRSPPSSASPAKWRSVDGGGAAAGGPCAHELGGPAPSGACPVLWQAGSAIRRPNGSGLAAPA